MFKNKDLHIQGGSNFSKFLFRNQYFKDMIDIKEVEVINYLFKKILIPKKIYLEKLNYYTKKYDLQELTCIQYRVGNLWKDSFKNNNLTHLTTERFIKCFQKISQHNKLVLVTDNLDFVKNEFKKNGIEIISLQGRITHSLKHSNIDYEKTLLDMLVIGECKNVIISYWSNYGRIGVLSALKYNYYLVEPDFQNNHENKLRQWRDNNDPDVIGFRKGELNEILSKECSQIKYC